MAVGLGSKNCWMINLHYQISQFISGCQIFNITTDHNTHARQTTSTTRLVTPTGLPTMRNLTNISVRYVLCAVDPHSDRGGHFCVGGPPGLWGGHISCGWATPVRAVSEPLVTVSFCPSVWQFNCLTVRPSVYIMYMPDSVSAFV